MRAISAKSYMCIYIQARIQLRMHIEREKIKIEINTMPCLALCDTAALHLLHLIPIRLMRLRCNIVNYE